MTSHPFLEFQEEKGEQSDFPGPQVSRLAARIRADSLQTGGFHGFGGRGLSVCICNDSMREGL